MSAAGCFFCVSGSLGIVALAMPLGVSEASPAPPIASALPRAARLPTLSPPLRLPPLSRPAPAGLFALAKVPARLIAARPVVSATPAQSLADRAYHKLAAGDKPGAAADFRAYLASHPADSHVWLDLAYLDADLAQWDLAVGDIDRYIALKPADDKAKLQRAYYLDSVKRTNAALKAFVALQISADPEVAKAAKAEVVARASAPGKPERGDVFGYIQNESRFGDNFYGFDARRSLGRAALSPYIILHYTADTRSGAGQGAQIFNDNAAVLDLGVRARIGANGPYVFVEAGEGFGLLKQGTKTDLRYGLAYSGDFGNPLGGHTTLDASIATYSRYTNTIMYAGLAHDFPLKGRFRGLVGANIALDAHREYANNYGEILAGVEYTTRRVKYRLVAAGGAYFSRGVGVPAKSTYLTIRPQVLFGFGL